jgi:chorismate mutase
MRLYALRGATSVDANDPESICAATETLLRALIERNDLASEQMVSCLFTATPDLDAEFPAVAARRLGLDGVALLCACEMGVSGAPPRIIRVLVHYHAPDGHRPDHVYLGAARSLRADLDAPQ